MGDRFRGSHPQLSRGVPVQVESPMIFPPIRMASAAQLNAGRSASTSPSRRKFLRTHSHETLRFCLDK